MAWYVGWDIGGAHLKFACIDKQGSVVIAQQSATPLWEGLAVLRRGVRAALQRLPGKDHYHAVTITAELVDIFGSRYAGLRQLTSLCTDELGDEVLFYAAENGFIKADSVLAQAIFVASVNWHATAVYIAARIQHAILIDVGSTTTDIVPIMCGEVSARGGTDQERLRFDELVYSGVVRTPIMSIIDKAPFRGEWQAIAREHFSTMADVYRVLGLLDPAYDMAPSSDGAPKDQENSIKRLARMLGTDPTPATTPAAWAQLAAFIAERQLQQLMFAFMRVCSVDVDTHIKTIIGAGAGTFLAALIAQRRDFEFIDFSELVDTIDIDKSLIHTCAPAVAVANLLYTSAR